MPLDRALLSFGGSTLPLNRPYFEIWSLKEPLPTLLQLKQWLEAQDGAGVTAQKYSTSLCHHAVLGLAACPPSCHCGMLQVRSCMWHKWAKHMKAFDCRVTGDHPAIFNWTCH